MCFLADALGGADGGRPSSAMSGEEISPFAESAIMATICGRVLTLKRQPVLEYGTPSTTQAFYLQHSSINTLLMTRLQMLTRAISSVKGHPDSMLVFLATSAYMMIFMLCETVESRPSSSDSAHTAFTDNRQRSLAAARELGKLMAELAQLNYFEVCFAVSSRFTQCNVCSGIETKEANQHSRSDPSACTNTVATKR